MGRPKKEQPNHGDLYEIKITIGRGVDGKPLRKSFYSPQSKEDARAKAKQWQIEKAVSEQTGETFIEKSIAFAEWANKWLEVYKKPNVDINTYHMTYEQTVRNHLIPHFGKADIKSIKPVDVQKFFDDNSHFSESVLKKFHMCLNGIFETAIENDLCMKNPVRHAVAKSRRKKNVKHVYSDEQIVTVKAYAKSHMPEVYVLLCTGVRRGELVGLQWKDFSTEEKAVSVKRSVADIQGHSSERIKINPPKWGSYRTIPVDDECTEFVKTLPHNGEYIFPNRKGNIQSPNTWSEKLKQFMDRLHAEQPDIPALTAHELRHTFGTALRRRGVDIYTIQKVMGHKDINMTAEIYVHNELDTLRENMKITTDLRHKK